ncbi:MAG: hypothetical protein NZ932_00755 [Candidatus Bathyarchaeota archaeon]|nr:hypothetical protein [Candidatus Bathyarchaeota archaeon]
MDFTEKEYEFLRKHFAELKEENPNSDFENYVKIIEYAKLNKKPELVYYYFYHYFEPWFTEDVDNFEESFTDEEKVLMRGIWTKLEILKANHGELTEKELLEKFGIDLDKLFKELGIHWKV